MPRGWKISEKEEVDDMNYPADNEFTWLLNILLIIVVAVIVLFFIRLIFKGKKENQKCEVTEIPAVYVSVDLAVSGNAMAGRMSRNADLGMPHSRKKAVFRFENGDTVEFSGNNEIPEENMLGKRGMLKYQGAKLLSFTVMESDL